MISNEGAHLLGTDMALKDIQTRISEQGAHIAVIHRDDSEATEPEAGGCNLAPAYTDGDDSDSGTPRLAHSIPVEPTAEERLDEILAQRYRLRRVLGSGGMGVVYLAHDLDLDVEVALKLLRRDVANVPSAVARFRREVRLTRQITHANVSRTFDIASHGPDLFITMERVFGRTLSACIAEVPFDPRQVAEIGIQLCSALAAAHRAGVVHRDLKPQNVMLEQDSSGVIARVVLMDFGISQTFDVESEEVTALGQLVGTPAYMSPEQLQGLPIDTRADLFSFGVILFELLTGRLPWRGSSATTAAHSRLRLENPDPRLIVPTIPTALAAVTCACLARSPDDRPSSALEIESTLQRWRESVRDPTDALPVRPGSEFPTITELVVGTALVAHSSTLDAPPSPDRVIHRSPPRPIRPANSATVRRPGSMASGIAVIPFHSGAGSDRDVDSGGVLYGLCAEIICQLSGIVGLSVQPLERVLAVRRRHPGWDSQRLGFYLGVSLVVEGSIAVVGGECVVRSRILDISRGIQVWADRLWSDRPHLPEASVMIATSTTQALLDHPEIERHSLARGN